MRNKIDFLIEKFNYANNVKTNNFDLLSKKYNDLSIRDKAISIDSYLEYLEEEVLPYCSNLLSPTYLGHMTSPLPDFIPELGRLVHFLNQNLVKIETSNGLTYLEKQVLGIFHKRLFLLDDNFYNTYLFDKDTSLGVITSGGTLANISAVWCFLKNINILYPNLSNQDNKEFVVIGSELLHFSFNKASELLGFTLEKIPINSNYKVDLNLMEKKIEECRRDNKIVLALIGIAGSTEFGSIDPLKEIALLARKYNIFYHVDAAWGGGFILSDKYLHLFDGIELADSVTIDGHKQLMTPIGCGLLFYRNSSYSKQTMHYAPYAVRKNSMDQGRFTIEGTRPANVIYLHALLNLIAKSGYDELFRKSLDNTRYFVESIRNNNEFELVNEPDLNIVNYRYIPNIFRNKKLDKNDNLFIDEFNVKLQERQKKYGRSFVSRTIGKLDNIKVVLLRAVLLNIYAQEKDIDFLINDQMNIAKELEKEMNINDKQ